MDPNTQRAEAERWLGIAVKLLTARDFLGSKTFAIRAREADPNNGISDQILAVVDTVLAGERRLSTSQQPDWYAVLQLPRLVRDPELIANHYRRLALLLNPDHNRLPFADYALQLTMEAWSVLSDPTKKWLFDNELAMSLQRPEPQQQQPPPVRVDPVRVDSGSGSGSGSTQLNTFQFFQPQPLPQSQPQQTLPMWQQQPHQQQQQQQQHSQREFMSPPPPPQPQQQQQQQQQQQMSSPPHPPFQQAQQLLPQWQMRDPTPTKGLERHKGPTNGGGGGGGGATVVCSSTSSAATPPPMLPPQNAQAVQLTTAWAAPEPAPAPAPVPARAAMPPPATMPVQVPPRVAPMPAPAKARVTSTSTATAVEDGNANANANANANNNTNSNNDSGNPNVASVSIPVPAPVPVPAAENHEGEDGVEEVDSFWTACPYCFYIYEYPKMYQDCTLRCQNCRRAFHAALIPNPPPIAPGGGGDGKDKEKENEKEKEKESSFCCWGFFPLGFSMAAWKKQNQSVNPNGSSNWVPFSPMFNCPTENGDGNFHWFASGGGDGGGNAGVGRKNFGTKSGVTRHKYVGRQSSAPRVYVDDEAYIELSEPSDSDSSDRDWRNPGNYKKKKVKRGRPRGKRGRPQLADKVNEGGNPPQRLTRGGGVSVGGEDLEDGSEGQQVVVGLVAGGARTDTSKNVAPALSRKQTRRTVKDMGRLDLNVEFHNEGEDHAPAVSAVNGEEDGIETIGFFEGLDEFLSTLPILNVGGDEKPKPS